MLLQPTAVPQYLSHSTGSTQATTSGSKQIRSAEGRGQRIRADCSCKRTGVEDPADHPREHHEEHGQKLQVAAQDTAGLNVGQVLGGQATLDDHLQQGNKWSTKV